MGHNFHPPGIEMTPYFYPAGIDMTPFFDNFVIEMGIISLLWQISPFMAYKITKFISKYQHKHG